MYVMLHTDFFCWHMEEHGMLELKIFYIYNNNQIYDIFQN